MNRWRILMTVAVVGGLLWWANTIVTRLYPPFDSPISTALWVLASVCKVVTILGLAWALGRVMARCYGSSRNSLIAAVAWSSAGLLLLTVLTLFRTPIAGMLNNECIRFFPTSIVRVDYGGFRSADDYPACVRRWQSGEILVEEVGVILVSSAGLALLGFAAGRYGTKAGALGVAYLWVVAVFVAGLLLRLISWDYDQFVCGTMIGALFHDAIVPYAISLPTEIGFLAYVGILASSWVLDARLPSDRA